MTAVIGRRRVRRAGTALLLAAAAAAATTAAASAGQPATAGTGVASSLVTTVHWGTCAHGIAKPFQCATAPVPLDYHKPSGAKITLSLLRLPASDKAKRIGSLFINFGGPGGPDITDLVNRAFTVFSPAVRQRFDLVAWDPRGIEYSDPVNCFASQAASDNYYNSVPFFPYPQVGNYFSLNAQLGKDCTSHAGTLLQHLATADTARDLDLLRQDVGGGKLNYLGFSYGTVIGATYANLFPANIRAMVLDGTLDFTGNATGHKPADATSLPVDVRQGVDKAGESSFQRFLALCKQAGSNCAFSGGDPAAKWSALLARAKAGNQNFSYQELVSTTYFDMESPIADWPGLASQLQDWYTATNAGRALPARQAAGLARAARQAARASLTGTAATASASAAGTAAAKYTGNRSDAFNAIQCADSKVPTQTSVYRNLGNSEDQKVPGFGRLVVFDMMPCATWPSSTHADVYNGPWGRSRTSILIINANHDPITPIWGARTAVSELHNARLLTVNGDGHTSMFVEPSACRDAAELAYLTSHKLPAAGTTCQVGQLPFGLPGPGSR
jgi:pimeloyl-ACP methyl ester carboxylesterase